MHPNEDIVFDLKGLSGRGGLSVRTLWKHINPKCPDDERLIASMVGGKVLVKWSNYLDWIDRREIKSDFNKKVDGAVISIKKSLRRQSK